MEQTPGDRARERLKAQNEEKARLERARRASKPIASRAGVPAKAEPSRPDPDPITAREFEVCHVTVVLRRKRKRGYDYHRLAVQVGCGTHLGDSKLDYVPVTSPAAHDLPKKGDVFGRDMARIVANELTRRRG